MNLFVYNISGIAVTLNFDHIFSMSEEKKNRKKMKKKKKKESDKRNKQMSESQRLPLHLHVGLRAHLQ